MLDETLTPPLNFAPPPQFGWGVTKFVPQKALKSIA